MENPEEEMHSAAGALAAKMTEIFPREKRLMALNLKTLGDALLPYYTELWRQKQIITQLQEDAGHVLNEILPAAEVNPLQQKSLAGLRTSLVAFDQRHVALSNTAPSLPVLKNEIRREADRQRELDERIIHIKNEAQAALDQPTQRLLLEVMRTIQLDMSPYTKTQFDLAKTYIENIVKSAEQQPPPPPPPPQLPTITVIEPRRTDAQEAVQKIKARITGDNIDLASSAAVKEEVKAMMNALDAYRKTISARITRADTELRRAYNAYNLKPS